MLLTLRERIQHAHQQALDCAERAAASHDACLRAEWLDLEHRWMLLGESYKFLRSLERFIHDSHRCQRELEFERE
jgi:hypothetical protein